MPYAAEGADLKEKARGPSSTVLPDWVHPTLGQ